MNKVLRLDTHIKDDFPLAVLYSGWHGDQAMHTHDFQELVIVLCGGCLHVSGSARYQISAGDVFVVSNTEPHGYFESDGVQLVNIIFDLKRLALPLDYLKDSPGFRTLFELEPQRRSVHNFESHLKLTPKSLEPIEILVARMKSELEGRRPCYKSMCVALLLELLSSLSRFQPDESVPARMELWNIGRVLRDMEVNYAKRRTLASMAKLAGMSKRSFQKAFSDAVGDSPINHLISLRVEKAARALLEKPSAKIGEIALAFGFCDGNYFTRQFVRVKGVSPRDYKKTHVHSAGPFLMMPGGET